MAATTLERESYFSGQHPSKLSYPAAASTKYLMGTMVGVDSAGRAAVIAAGVKAIGVVAATADNSAGANDAMDVDCLLYTSDAADE